MDNEQANCILGICCCEENCADKRRKALADVIQTLLAGQPCTPAAVANLLLNTFDFARKGTLEPLFKDIAILARGKDYTG